MRGVLFITVEGMGTGLVGTYGSNIGATPTLDEMAAHGIVLDQCFLDSTNLVRQLTSLASCRHAMQSPANVTNLWQLLQSSGDSACFLTDSPQAAEWAADSDCERVVLVEPPAVQQAACKSHECAVVSLFANAAEEIENSEAAGFFWIHSSGLRLPWDVPLTMRARFADPDDPEPPQEIGPPCFDVTPTTDPDAVVGWGQVAAAQISLVDDCVATLLAMIANRTDSSKWSCAIVGLGSVPLGEHERVGWGRPQLHGEELQCVAIVQPAPPAPIGWRRAELFQLPDIGATIRHCLGFDEPESAVWGRNLLQWIPSDIPVRWRQAYQVAILKTENQLWLRSPAWSAVWQTNDPAKLEELIALGEKTPVKLYVKPDDRWEVSEIGDRCPHIVEALCHTAVNTWNCLEKNDRELLPALEEPLCDLLR